MMHSFAYNPGTMVAGYRPDRVKARRLELGMTQKDLAVAAHTNQSDISRIERGETEVTPDDAKRQRIATALGMSVEDIYDSGVASAPAGPTFHREVDDQSAGDAHAIFEAAILRAVAAAGPDEYTMGDVDAARETSRELAAHMEGSDPLEMVRAWLRSARYFRFRRVKPTPAMIAGRALVGYSQQAEKADAEATSRTGEVAANLADDLGLRTEGPSPKAQAARQRAVETATRHRSK